MQIKYDNYIISDEEIKGNNIKLVASPDVNIHLFNNGYDLDESLKEIGMTEFTDYGAIYNYNPGISKNILANLKYWDQDGNVNNGHEMIYYQQDFNYHEVRVDSTAYFVMLQNFKYEDLIKLFKGNITRLSTTSAKDKNGVIHNNVTFDVIRGNDPYFTQMHINEYINIYPDAVYLLWNKPLNIDILVEHAPVDPPKLDIFVIYAEEDDYAELWHKDEDLTNKSLKFVKEISPIYPYKEDMLGQGRLATIEGLDKIIAEISDIDKICVKCSNDLYFTASVEDIKNSPSKGKEIAFICYHNNECETYGYYY